MKRRRTALPALLLSVLLLASCAAADSAPASRAVPVELDGQSLVIQFDQTDWGAGTITAPNGEYAFSYDLSGGLTIRYPDGYCYTQQEKAGGIAFPADYDAAEIQRRGYLDGFSLSWAIESAAQSAQEGAHGNASPSPLLAALLLGLGMWNLLDPRGAWWLARGWWYKDAQPSQAALLLYRGAGVLLLLAGLLCLLASL